MSLKTFSRGNEGRRDFPVGQRNLSGSLAFSLLSQGPALTGTPARPGEPADSSLFLLGKDSLDFFLDFLSTWIFRQSHSLPKEAHSMVFWGYHKRVLSIPRKDLPPLGEGLSAPWHLENHAGLHWWLRSKESACQCRRHRFHP